MMAREIGGYLELADYSGREYYPQAIALNCGRNALAYLIEAKNYTKVFVPAFCCDSVADGIRKGGATVEWYQLDKRLRPIIKQSPKEKEAVLIVNYYGQISNAEIIDYQNKFAHIIIDNTQAFFQAPIPNADTIYSCRKFFGVADGAYLVSDVRLNRELPVDKSAERMLFVLGRYDECASKYYVKAAENNEMFSAEKIKKMSRLTHNILRREDYKYCAERRTDNAAFLHAGLKHVNILDYRVPYGAFMYPLLLDGNGAKVRKYLQQHKIYVPCLWPDVLERETNISRAYFMADNILPLPCDQRYGLDEMKFILKKINRLLAGEERAY